MLASPSLRLAFAVALAACASMLSAQTPVPAKAAASAEPLLVDAHPSPYRSVTDFRTNISHQRFEMRDATVLNMIAFAYEREDQAIVGGPSWIEFDRFDIAAKIASLEPPTSTPRPHLPELRPPIPTKPSAPSSSVSSPNASTSSTTRKSAPCPATS